MDRRGMLSLVGALALAALMGVGATAAEKIEGRQGGVRLLRRCLRLPRLHLRCDRQGGRTVKAASAAAGRPAALRPAKAAECRRARGAARRTPRSTQVAKASCACCGDACSCPACSCDTTAKAGAAKAGTGCDCCGGDACCTSPTEAAKVEVAVVR